jgi:hypothetical protein
MGLHKRKPRTHDLAQGEKWANVIMDEMLAKTQTGQERTYLEYKEAVRLQLRDAPECLEEMFEAYLELNARRVFQNRTRVNIEQGRFSFPTGAAVPLPDDRFVPVELARKIHLQEWAKREGADGRRKLQHEAAINAEVARLEQAAGGWPPDMTWGEVRDRAADAA